MQPDIKQQWITHALMAAWRCRQVKCRQRLIFCCRWRYAIFSHDEGTAGIGRNPVDVCWPNAKKEYFDMFSSFLKLDACTLERVEVGIPKFCKKELAVYAASFLHIELLGARYRE